MKKSLTRMIATGALAVAPAVAFATPAAASEVAVSHIIVGGTSVGTVVNGQLTLAFDCAATATGTAVSVAITRCQISTGGGNRTLALPGNTATIAGTASVPLAPYSLCITATATYLNASTRTVSTCTPLLPLSNGAPQTTFAMN